MTRRFIANEKGVIEASSYEQAMKKRLAGIMTVHNVTEKDVYLQGPFGLDKRLTDIRPGSIKHECVFYVENVGHVKLRELDNYTWFGKTGNLILHLTSPGPVSTVEVFSQCVKVKEGLEAIDEWQGKHDEMRIYTKEGPIFLHELDPEFYSQDFVVAWPQYGPGGSKTGDDNLYYVWVEDVRYGGLRK